MGKIVCFINKNMMIGTFCKKNTINYDKCNFKEKFKGKEKEEFSYCFLLGELE